MRIRVLAIASLGIVLAGQPVFSQSLSRYRTYTLESSLAAILKSSGARQTDLQTLHERPAKIQVLEWRAPYVSPGNVAADPVHSLLFSFYDDQLYRIVVTYDRDRMEGLTRCGCDGLHFRCLRSAPDAIARVRQPAARHAAGHHARCPVG